MGLIERVEGELSLSLQADLLSLSRASLYYQPRQDALRIWQQLDRPDKVGHTLRWLSRISWMLGKRGEAEQYAVEAVRLLETLAPSAELAMAYSNRAQLSMLAEDDVEALRWGDHASRAYANLASSAVQARDYTRATRYLRDGIAYCVKHDLDVLDEARALALATGELQRVAPVAAARSEAAWLQGNKERCLAEAQVGYDLALKHEADPWTLGELCIWMWRAGGLSSAPGAIAEPFAREIAGDWRGAAALWAEIGCPYEQALALTEGDAPAKLSALALFEQLGAQPALALVKQRMRQQGIRGIPRGPHSSTRANQAGLTGRQLEVLLLLAEGLPNAEIASRLSASLHTIDHHVSAVLAKLDVHSRAQAVSTAYQMGIIPKK